MDDKPYDFVVVGAGPAGMAAAVTAARLGGNCLVIDEQPGPGGQIFRNIEDCPLREPALLGPDYAEGEALAADFRQARPEYLSGTTLWHLDGDGAIGLSREGRAWSIKARYVLLATGAMERPSPIPGWTLPGVMAAGAGQILLKTSAMVPKGPLVLAGSGPLLFLLAWQYLNAGAEIAGFVDTTPRANFLKAAPLLPKALGASGYLVKGLGYMRALARAGVPRFSGATDLRVEGESKVTGLSFSSGGRRRSIACDTLFLHQGVVPNVQITRALGCEHTWDDRQACWRPALDPWGRTDSHRIYVAGDGGGIGGAAVARIQGTLAALEIGRLLGLCEERQRDAEAGRLRAEMARHLRIRPFLDALYRPADAIRCPGDETVVCRCEEVTAGEIRGMVRMGCLGPNQTKSFGRPGMGPCQGRMCGLTVSEVIAAERRLPVSEIGYYRIRPPIKPITLAELAAFEPPGGERT